MSELVKAKERQLLDEIEDAEFELKQQKDFYSEYFTKIDQERQVVENETNLNFEEDIAPLKQEFTQNELETEEVKEQIRQIKTHFERLRTNLIHDAKHAESSTLDQVKVEDAVQMQNLDAQIKEISAQSENLKSRFESGTQMAEKMAKKLEVSKGNLINGEALLREALIQTQVKLDGQIKELDELHQIRHNAGHMLELKLQDLEGTQNNLQQKTIEWDRIESGSKEEQAQISTHMGDLLSQGEKRMIELDDAIKKFQTETQKLKDRNIDQI